MTDMSSPPSFMDPEVMQNPFPMYQWALANSPVMEIPGTGMKIVMSYDMCSEATGRVEEFSNDFTGAIAGAMAEDPEVKAIIEKGWPQINTLLTADPPVHTRFRKLVNLAFSMPRVNALEDGIRAKVNRLIDGFIDKGECEIVSEFSVSLPVQVICEQLGFELSEQANVKRWSDAFADRLGHMISKERELECAHEVVEFQHAVKAKIDARRATPTDDLLSDIVNARIDGERPLDDAEILSVAQQLMVAGNETTTHSLAGGIVHLAQNPDAQAKVRANPAIIPNMIEEVLRLDTPTAGMWRVVKKDCSLGGHDFKAGEMIMLRYAAANRDPAKYADPDRFDPERQNARTHLAFGKGIHMCVGNMLSRKEMTVAFQQLLARLDDIRIADGAELKVSPNLLLRGLISAPITFRKIA
ncbi:MAG: cytochrome P450 [Sphingomonadales bacterium]|jgi:cytochrome P450|nr:cytochrome P450 [Sphingorhabdus sp.]WRH75190.1 MAG: cytochrome P450 [Sphingobium sp.]